MDLGRLSVPKAFLFIHVPEKKPIALIHVREKKPIALIHVRENKLITLIHVWEKGIIMDWLTRMLEEKKSAGTTHMKLGLEER